MHGDEAPVSRDNQVEYSDWYSLLSVEQKFLVFTYAIVCAQAHPGQIADKNGVDREMMMMTS